MELVKMELVKAERAPTKFKLFVVCPKHRTYMCFCPIDSAARIFIDIVSRFDKLISIAFIPWVGVDPTVVLHLKEGPHGTHNRSEVNFRCAIKQNAARIFTNRGD